MGYIMTDAETGRETRIEDVSGLVAALYARSYREAGVERAVKEVLSAGRHERGGTSIEAERP